MRLIYILPLVAALALGACGRDDKPKSEDEVKDAMANMVKPKPGLYRSTAKLVSFEVPGMPAAQAERLKEVFSQQAGREVCLSKAEADKGYEEMTKKLAAEGKCQYDRFDARGGTIDAKMSCETGKDMKATIELKGTMSEEGSQLHMKVEQAAPNLPNGGSVKMEADVASQRIGDCPVG